jgi:Caspase domain/PDZ domain
MNTAARLLLGVALSLASLAVGALPPARAACSQDVDTLHILVVADTTDELVGQSCLVDLKTIKSYFAESSNIPRNRQTSITLMTGDPPPQAAKGALRYSRDAILGHYKGLAGTKEVKQSDTILFYYSGHGGYVPGKGHCIYTPKDREHRLFRTELRQAILECKPRLAVIITDSCAKALSKRTLGPKGLREDRAQMVESLFFTPSGVVDINSSSQGQVSAGSDEGGGIFTSVFFEKLGLEIHQIELELKKKGLPVKTERAVTWREIFPLLLGPTAARYKTAVPDGEQTSQDPQAFCLPKEPLFDPPLPFKHGLAVDAVLKDGRDVLIVRTVDTGSAAEKGGLRPGDAIISIDGKDVSNDNEFDCAINFPPDPDKVTVTFARDSKSSGCVLKLDRVK